MTATSTLNQSLAQLSTLLRQNHYRNANGCLVTDYHKIPGLKVLASTTNGTSGIGRYNGVRVYWSLNDRTSEYETERTR